MKKIGIGYEDYREFIDQDMYYVDKTLLVRDVLEKDCPKRTGNGSGSSFGEK